MRTLKAAILLCVALSASANAQPTTITIEARPLPGHPHTANGFYRNNSVVCQEEGQVLLDITVEKDGKVSGSRLVRSSLYPDLDSAAGQAVRTWKYLPATADGKPVRSHKKVALIFITPTSTSVLGSAFEYAMSLGCRTAKYAMTL